MRSQRGMRGFLTWLILHLGTDLADGHAGLWSIPVASGCVKHLADYFPRHAMKPGEKASNEGPTLAENDQ